MLVLICDSITSWPSFTFPLETQSLLPGEAISALMIGKSSLDICACFKFDLVQNKKADMVSQQILVYLASIWLPIKRG